MVLFYQCNPSMFDLFFEPCCWMPPGWHQNLRLSVLSTVSCPPSGQGAKFIRKALPFSICSYLISVWIWLLFKEDLSWSFASWLEQWSLPELCLISLNGQREMWLFRSHVIRSRCLGWDPRPSRKPWTRDSWTIAGTSGWREPEEQGVLCLKGPKGQT